MPPPFGARGVFVIDDGLAGQGVHITGNTPPTHTHTGTQICFRGAVCLVSFDTLVGEIRLSPTRVLAVVRGGFDDNSSLGCPMILIQFGQFIYYIWHFIILDVVSNGPITGSRAAVITRVHIYIYIDTRVYNSTHVTTRR